MPLPTLETTLYSVDRGIATITLNRPDKLNAYNARMREELIALFDETDADDNVRVVVITGAGRAFCAGADLSSGGATFDRKANPGDLSRESLKVGDVYRDGGGTNTLRIFESLKPVIGAINGPAVGIGATMQLPMDMRLASTQARFGFVFARRGITLEAASSWFLPGWSACRPRLSGVPPDACSAPRKRLRTGWSVRCMRPRNCFPPPMRWQGRSPTIPPRSRWR